jgi:polyphosphate kinase
MATSQTSVASTTGSADQVENPLAGRDDVSASSRYLSRELSLLEYNARILARGEDASLPLLERVKALHYFCRAIDDFFQIRVAGLKEQIEVASTAVSLDGRTPAEQLHAIRATTLQLLGRERRVWYDDMQPALAAEGIRIVDVGDLSNKDAEVVAGFFSRRVFPVLTPLAVDPGHPFPYISHFSLNLALEVRDPVSRVQRFTRLKVPQLLPRFLALPDGKSFVPLERVIAAHLQTLFPGMEILSHSAFRVTRDNDLDVRDDEADDLLVTIKAELVRSRRRARVVRLEVSSDMPEQVRELLLGELELSTEDAYVVDGLLDLGDVAFFVDLDRPDLKAEPFSGITPARLATSNGEPADIFSAIGQGDILVHHPYDSYAATVVRFIQQAAADPAVVAIKQTLYRTSGPASPIVTALARAAEAGKQVAALVELKARGDEQANIEWAQRLEEAGVHVVYGLVGLKTHAKLVMVVREEAADVRRYCHVATGNYNPSTAKGYEDLGLLTANPDIGRDVGDLFNFLTGYSRQQQPRCLLVAPNSMRTGLLELIGKEAGEADGHIVMKVNNLTDVQLIDALYDGSKAGAQVDLIVRSICCLRPGVPGLSEEVRVRSVVGNFLEHSRIFRFGSGGRGYRFYIGSADMMDRNLDRRVEAVTPIDDPELQARLSVILDLELADDTLAWRLEASGAWSRVPPTSGVNAQERLKALAYERARPRSPTAV